MLAVHVVPYGVMVVPPTAKPGPLSSPYLIQLPSGPLFFASRVTMPALLVAVMAQLTLLLIETTTAAAM